MMFSSYVLEKNATNFELKQKKHDENIAELESRGPLTEVESKVWDGLVDTQKRESHRLRHLTTILVFAREGVVEKQSYVTMMVAGEDKDV
ncbi:hypothetical protein CTI12_AA620700 [Artemisia annua]|uniref:Uncharacterized protein n=1 Tax=Artemisia annua TaxID=35608 RepID=A0A2U1KBP7_ARTAN|nr:hypothetical protein CTI12_AA620700 [Artemisia annua]